MASERRETDKDSYRPLDDVRQRIAAGLASLDEGKAIPGEAVFDELEQGLSAETRQKR
jgi:hypothetical protein